MATATRYQCPQHPRTKPTERMTSWRLRRWAIDEGQPVAENVILCADCAADFISRHPSINETGHRIGGMPRP